jgi:hypothetical protein
MGPNVYMCWACLLFVCSIASRVSLQFMIKMSASEKVE